MANDLALRNRVTAFLKAHPPPVLPAVKANVTFDIGMACSAYRKPFLVKTRLIDGVAWLSESVAQASMGGTGATVDLIGKYPVDLSRWTGCPHCGVESSGGVKIWWSTTCKCAPLFHCMGSTTCYCGQLYSADYISSPVAPIRGVLPRAGGFAKSSQAVVVRR